MSSVNPNIWGSRLLPLPAIMAELGRRSRWRDWSSLLPDLLSLIAHKLPDIVDYVAFRSVCSPWRSAATPAGLRPQLPWILLRHHPDSPLRLFLSVSTGNIYTFNLPEARARVAYASPHGSLLVVDGSLAVSLLNPITRAQLHLPPLPVPVDRLSCLVQARDEHFRYYPHNRGLTPPSPLLVIPSEFKFYPFHIAGECAVGLVLEGTVGWSYSTVPDKESSWQFMYWREKDNAWVTTDPVSGFPIVTVAYHAGRFYIVHENGDVATCDLGDEGKLVLVSSLKVPVEIRRCFLVVVGADLLMVTIVNDLLKKQRFHCFKLEESRWLRIKGIGDYSIFVTNEEQTIIAPAGEDAGEETGILRNCMYTAELMGPPSRKNLRVVSIDRVDCGLGSYRLDSLAEELESSWFVPSLC